MATTNYNFTQPNESLPIYPNGIEDISEALDQIDSTIKNISDATSQALGEVDNSFENINNAKIDKSVVTAKGDLIVGLEEEEVTNLPIGEEGQVLTVVLTEDEEPELVLQWVDLPEPPEPPEIPEIPEQMVLTGAELPVASIEYRGKIFLLEGDIEVSDIPYVCIKDETDTFVWKAINFISA